MVVLRFFLRSDILRLRDILSARDGVLDTGVVGAVADSSRFSMSKVGGREPSPEGDRIEVSIGERGNDEGKAAEFCRASDGRLPASTAGCAGTGLSSLGCCCCSCCCCCWVSLNLCSWSISFLKFFLKTRSRMLVRKKRGHFFFTYSQRVSGGRVACQTRRASCGSRGSVQWYPPEIER